MQYKILTLERCACSEQYKHEYTQVSFTYALKIHSDVR